MESLLSGLLQPTNQGFSWREFANSDAADLLVTWVGVLLGAWLANFIAKRVILRGVHALVGRTKAQWDDQLVKRGVFHKLSHLAPALVFYYTATELFPGDERTVWSNLLMRLATVWMIFAGARSLASFLDVLVDLAQRDDKIRGKPLRSYAQVIKLLLWLTVGIVGVATMMDKSPMALLTGLGAMTAIILLVFKDSILGFVASIQMAGYDMVRVGDWVEMPKYGADGDVIEISLNTVKIQNWDKTISTVPTYAFMSDSFKNWRGMAESGGRRIKRALSIDMRSVHLLEDEDIQALRKVQYIDAYLQKKSEEVAAWNQEHGFDLDCPVNGRRLTNLGTFRAYVESYLRNHPQIHKDMTFLVRQLPPSAEGVPIEIYVFSSEQRWAHYEAIIADIFDHLLAVLPEFGLSVYQRLSGSDIQRALKEVGNKEFLRNQ